MIQFTKYPAVAELSEYIQYYFSIDTTVQNEFSEKTVPQSLTNHPQGTVDLMFTLKGGIQLDNFKKEAFQLHSIFIMPQQEGYFKVTFAPNSYIIGVVFYAESFKRLFNLPLDEISNKGMGLDDHVSPDYRDVYMRLMEAGSIRNRLDLLNQFYLDQLRQTGENFDKFDELIRYIRKAEGKVKISDLADAGNMSERSLQRKMKEVTGVTPKSYTNIIRFKTLLAQINSQPQQDWQDILFQGGYFDQAHFIKDFKKYTGKTPRQFVQDKLNLSRFFLTE